MNAEGADKSKPPAPVCGVCGVCDRLSLFLWPSATPASTAHASSRAAAYKSRLPSRRIANPNTTTANIAAYQSAVVLGIDTFANGENDNDPANGVCISNAARRHNDSLGMMRLVISPIVTIFSLCEKPLTCSSH